MTTEHSQRGDDGVVLHTKWRTWIQHLPLFLSSALTYSISLSIPVSLSALFLDWQSYFHASRAETAPVQSTCSAILFAGAVIPGYLMNRFGARATVVMGTCLSTSGLVISSFATSIPYLIVSTGVMCGLGSCLIYLPCIPCVTSSVKEGRSLIISTISTIGGGCCALMPHFLSYQTEVFGWRGACLIMSGLSLNTLVTGLVMTSSYSQTTSGDVINSGEDEDESLDGRTEECLSEKREFNGIETVGEEDLDELQTSLVAHSACSKGSAVSVSRSETASNSSQVTTRDDDSTPSSNNSKWRFMKDPLFVVFLLNVSVGLSSMGSFTFLLVDFANSLDLEGKKEGLFFLSVVLISSLVSRLAVGVVNMFPAFHSVAILSTSSAAGGCLLLGFGHVTSMTSYTLVVAMFVFYGFAFGSFLGIYQKVPLDMASVDEDTYYLALGVVNSAEGISYLYLPSLIAYAVDQSGSYLLPMSTMGVCALCMAIVLQLTSWSTMKKGRTKS